MSGNAWELAATLPTGSVQAIITSPPYWKQRRYSKSDAEFGHSSLIDYVDRLADLFDRLKPALAADGAMWLNIGDSYEDNRQVRVGEKVVDAMEAKGWALRCEVIFDRLNFAPRPAPLRPVLSYERVFLLSPKWPYFYDETYMREPAKYAGYVYERSGSRVDDGRLRMDGKTVVGDTRQMRAVWTGATGWNDVVDHPALMPRLMAERCVRSLTRENDLVLDPFSGAATTGVFALEYGRRYVGFELSETYAAASRERLAAIARQPKQSELQL